ncbi:MAG: Dam family site-specific DNA-(adenine-N6)-methyltransferase [Candidatus Phytoplasma australasiaticum]|nr:Dam family site-specific DNA-(adenine-N6)-methyltransferase [Candidatus Phytoplasma australasiaticum]
MKISWIGSKKKMLPQLLKYIPTKYNNYYEPFLGSGALFQSLTPSTAILNDNDEHLIALWRHLLVHPPLFGVYVGKWENQIFAYKEQKTQKEAFKNLLVKFNKSALSVSKSALFYVLLKYAFRGVFRYLAVGTIQLSFGFKKRLTNPIIDLAEIRKIKNNVKNLKLVNDDFETVINQTQSHDFIFVDPPYWREGIKDKNFYQKPFLWEDHQRLYQCLLRAHERKVKWLYTNYHSAHITTLFKDFHLLPLPTTTNCRLTAAQVTQEVIIKNY